MSTYKEFAQKARERFEKKRALMTLGKGGYQFTRHAQYKMKQYGLSEQRVRSVIRSPRRREEAIVPKMIAVMQPVSPKKINGKETWKQEIWVMIVAQVKSQKLKVKSDKQKMSLEPAQIKIISAWRYPGVSPKRNPIPDDILRELEDRSILEAEEII